ncbi:cystatin-B-like [Anomaloglossus baeobatrachus]|uniref:cystatin-B-like n=1 Tax=Anomaloglossus baeobatrachus TaxID=238106 RepID=UPI003F50A43D
MAASALLGGYGEEHPANADAQAICDKVKDQFEEQKGINVKLFVAESFRVQHVEGKNWKIKVNTGGHYCHIEVHEYLQHHGKKPKLEHIKCGKTKEDKL